MELQAYEKSPIYRKARELLRDAYRLVSVMSKQHKYSLGTSITGSAQSLIEAVFLAYEERENLPVKLLHIARIKEATHLLLIQYRIADELRQIQRKEYAPQVESLISIIKQTRGWERKTQEALGA